MFSFFKKKSSNPISDVFAEVTTNQRYSIMNMLLSIAGCDEGYGNSDKELQYLNTYIDILNIRSRDSMAYLENFGHDRMLSDLNSLSPSIKEFLVIVTQELINCDARPNELEINYTLAVFDKIGISEEKYLATIEKTQALMKHFMG